MNDLVSIVIPYYNKEKTIERAVSSVLNQTHSNWELFIIDDKSSVALTEILTFRDKRIVILENENNVGPGPTRQRGLDLAKGEFVAFLDADDWWSEKFIEKSIEKLTTNSKLIASWCLSRIYTDDSADGHLRRYNEMNHSNIKSTLLKYGHTIQTSAYLWRRNACGKWGNLSTNQDSYFEYSCSLKGFRISKVDNVLLFRDETGDEHRKKYVPSDAQYLNSFFLYCYVYDNVELNKIQRIFLLNRYLLTYSKLVFNKLIISKELEYEYKRRFKPFTSILGHHIILLKIILKLFRLSPFKVYS